jgi:hypothetical protein
MAVQTFSTGLAVITFLLFALFIDWMIDVC